ncbi:MAG: fasciclin domain-containing protein [Prevotella sp.]|nr:fasciclin domain-containing protein [Prevotella sp.]
MTSCQEREWDNYYGEADHSGQSLMEAIDARPDLSAFAGVVRQYGMESLLGSSQSLTVFAPTNDALSSYALTDDALSQFLYNHVCRYTYTQGDVMEADDGILRVKMLNGKYQNLVLSGGGLLFGNLGHVSSSQGVGNGVLNTIDCVVPFYNNIYEEIKKTGNETDSIGKYLRQHDRYTFLPDKSTVVGTNDKGETVYDSVFNFRNEWIDHYGSIHLEDSVYTMLVPTNKAWDKHYDKLRSYFKAYGDGEIKTSSINVTGTLATADRTADSLTHNHTVEAIMQDLVFRKVVDVAAPDGDSLVATSGHVFHAPQYLFTDAEQRGVSNGQLFVTDELKHQAHDSWHREIRVEAEDAANYATLRVSSTSSKSVVNYPQFAGQVSENGFLVVKPMQATSQRPTVRFRLPNTLSATYNIYIVTVPASAIDTALVDSETLRSTRLRFYLRYVHEDGTLKEDAAITTPVDYGGTQTPKAIDSTNPEFITDARNVNKMLVARNFRFPFANFTNSIFQSSEVDVPITAFLRVEGNVTTAAALTQYERDMRIDCIILEPVD